MKLKIKNKRKFSDKRVRDIKKLSIPMLGFCKFNFGHRQAFYDIMHHEICLGFMSISWGDFAFDWNLS